MSSPIVSVVIPTYMRRQNLARLIEPLLDDQATFEVIVVVDGGDDGSYELLRSEAERDPRLLPLMTENQGQSAAQQHGAERARGEVLLFLDDDVFPGPGLVSGHALHHRESDDAVVVGYMPVTSPDPLGPSDWIVVRYAGRYERMVERWERDPDAILRHLWGGNVSIRRTHLSSLPMSCPGADLSYHVDWELGLRCQSLGLHGVFDRALRASHHYHRTATQFLRDRTASAADRAVIHRLHSDAIGPLPPDFFWKDAPPLRRIALCLVRLAPPAVVEGLLARAIDVAGRCRRHRLEAAACDYLDRLRGHRIASGRISSIDVHHSQPMR